MGNKGVRGILGDSTLLFRLLIAAILTLFAIYSPIPQDQARWHPLVAIGAYLLLSLGLSWRDGRPGGLGTAARLASYFIDIAVITFTMYFLRGVETDLYVAYFIVILMSVKTNDLRQNILVGFTSCGVYWWVLMESGHGSVFSPDFLLRFPFLLIVCVYTTMISHQLGVSEESLKEANERLREANALLEERVRGRTMDLRAAVEELTMVNDLICSSFRIRTVDEFWPVLSRKLKAFFRCERLTMFLQDKAGGLHSLYADGLKEPIHLSAGTGIAGLVARNRRAFFSNDPYKEPGFHPDIDRSTGFVTRNLMCCPLVRDEEVTGVAELLNKEGGFLDADAEAVSRLATQIQMVYDKLKGDIDRHGMQASLMRSERLASIGRLMAGLAHEIRNPLAGILANTQLLLRDTGPGDSRREMLGDIEMSAKNCNAILGNLLLFSHKDAPPGGPAAIEGIVEEALRLFGKRFESSRIELRRRYSAKSPKVLCRGLELQQVIINLLANARDAMPGGGALTLRTDVCSLKDALEAYAGESGRESDARLLESGLGAPKDGGKPHAGPWVVFEITDSGSGIDPAILDQVFEPFFSTKPLGEGTGLGLSVSREIVDRHGGALLAYNNPGGKGATFLILLPACDPLSESPGSTLPA